MKKYFLISLSLMIFGFLFLANSVSAIIEAETTSNPTEIKVLFPDSKFLRGKVDLVASISNPQPESAVYILIGKAITEGNLKEIIIGENECKTGSEVTDSVSTETRYKCIIASWDTTLLPDGQYKIWITTATPVISDVFTTMPSESLKSEQISAVIDNTAPEITLKGITPMDINVGDTFEDLGATATDVISGSVDVKISGSVDINTVGTYKITYTATDTAGNVATLARIVNVNTFTVTPPVSHGGGGSSGSSMRVVTPSLTEIPGCDTRTTGFSTVTGQSCRTNISHSDNGQVLGAEKFNFTLLLKYGARSEEVTELHKVLIEDGYLKILAPTGFFGPLTLKAVKEYQIANDLVGDGIVGPLTREVLNK